MRYQRGELWRHSDFRKLWFGESVSLIGTYATQLVFPLVAVTYLHASPTELGVVSAAQFAPALLLTLVAGHWADRVGHRPMLVGSNLARMATLAAAVALLETGGLRVWSWCVVAFVLGTFTAAFDVAWHSYLPVVVERRHLVEGNAKMQASYSVAQLAGAGLGGWLLKVLSPAAAFLLDIASYAFSVVALLAIRTREPRRAKPPGTDESTSRRLTHGVRLLWRDRVLRALLLEGTWFNLCEQALLTLFMIYAVRFLDLDAGQVGLCVALGSIGAVAGSVVAADLERRWGTARTLVVAIGLASGSPVLVPLANGPQFVAVALIVLSFNLYGLGLTVFNVHNLSQRQARTDPAALGRVTAAFSTIALGALPLGAVVGGLLGDLLGVRLGLTVVAAAFVAGWLLFALTLPRLFDAPSPAPAPAPAAPATVAGEPPP
ncbi:MFS transporter [Micromonospora narathiwatensis]|uniref:Predicted arabinose efflux permease, MFS family n=1 Tax=Micromonospora narathiwatensis TaxID=299146 RepID=A0A1A8ZGB8_9ACTN|nr:MFS transporter [Micromonospora narathiwatensis]SBT42912.1 Predicted arabinose efflux permease, MFS family [Micromonospora narathiwatensis]